MRIVHYKMQITMNETHCPEYIYRMTHIDNINYILSTGLCSPLHRQAALNYTEIGDPVLIRERSGKPVPIAPGGVIPEYVSFYFGGRMPMLWAILHAHELLFKRYQSSEVGWLHRFEAPGTNQRHQQEIVFVACNFQKVVDTCPEWCFTDGHVSSPRTHFYNDLADLARLDWRAIERHDTSGNWESARRRQAEFLVKGLVPVGCIDHLVVRYPKQKEQLEGLLKGKGLSIPVIVDSWPKLFFKEEGLTIGQLIPLGAPSSATTEEEDDCLMEALELQSRVLGQVQDVEPELSYIGDSWDAEREEELAMEHFEEMYRRFQEETEPYR